MKTEFKEKIDKLIINSPFAEPDQHWEFEKTKGKHFIKEGRRPAGYVIASQSKKYREAGDFIELPLVNKIRPRVKKWRDQGYPGVTGITKRLLDFWNTKKADGRDYEFFFCQKEAMETLIWLKEAHASEKVGIEIPKDGGNFERLCTKMATGTGKTYVMAMTIAWQILNKIAYPQDARFSKYVFIVAPNLTVKSRLAVLDFNNSSNYYEEKKIVPYDLLSNLRQGTICIENWHALMWDSEETIQKRKSVDKRGALSDEVYIRDVLGDMNRAKNILVINDEAHHAWRSRSEEKQRGLNKEEEKRATCWIQGLDRIHRARGILSCFDFSATPFAPSGTRGSSFCS
ncbi:MAG: DEAD/DEAH box helicase family protein, partial [Bdellovibrionales bacterium]|nr:DEAD/DEAH box helicase family protein [Bdellovibrionales bacterium]